MTTHFTYIKWWISTCTGSIYNQSPRNDIR